MKTNRLAIIGVIALALGGAPAAQAQYSANYQTNIISGVTNSSSSNYLVGNGYSFDVLLIQSAGKLLITGGAYGAIGNTATDSNNIAVVSGTGSVWSNSTTEVGNNASGNLLVISNGGAVVDSRGDVGNAPGANNNSALVTGSGSVWTNTGQTLIGHDNTGNSLVISNGGAVVDNAAYIGSDPTCSNNSVVVTGSGSVWTTASQLFVGQTSSSNTLFISNGGAVVDNWGYEGQSSGSNSVVVSGVGSVWSHMSDFYVGYNTYYGGNSLVISNGGAVLDPYGYVGYNAPYSSAVVSGVGSVWSNSIQFYVGSTSIGNSLVISNGGAVVDPSGFIGYNNSTNNSVVVTGSGSVWSNSSQLTVGYSYDSVNSLVISNGGAVIAPGLVVGYLAGCANNLVTLNGGSLAVTGTLGVNWGAFTMNGGTAAVGTLLLTNGANSELVVNGGSLTATTATIGAGSVLQFGLGTNSQPVAVTGNLILGGTLNITAAGGFTNGGYTLFTYGGTLTTNGIPTILTIGTKPNTNWTYVVDISSPGYVRLDVGSPMAGFSGSPTNGVAPLAVTFTDNSTGNITNRFWNLGDGTTTNTTATNLSHTYAAGTYTVSLTVSGPAGTNTSTLANYIVVITPAQLGVNPGTLTYGSVTVGLTNSLSFSVINSGQQTLTGTVATASPFLIASGSPYTVAGGQTQTVSVAFAPVAAGSFTNNVIFTSANGGVATNVINGTGLTAGNIGVTPASYSFGALTTGTTAQTTLVVTNSGGTAVSNGTVSVTGPYSILSGATFSIAGFGTTNVVVQFAPVAVGSFTNNVIFTSANGGATTNAVNGTGLAAGNISVTPASYSFGALTTGTTAQTTLVVTNSGGTAVSNGTVSVTGPYSILSGATFSVPGFGTTNVVVQFAPVAVGGFTNNVTFTSANGGVSTNAVNGTGLAAGNISVTPASYSFGALTTGTTAQTTLVVTNSGGTAVSNGTVSVTGPYSILSGATFSVPGFGTTNVVVQFAPVTVGSFTNNVIFTSANGGTASNTVSGTGAIVPVALFTGSPTNGVAPLAVTFTDSSTGTITNRLWNLGDGTTTNTMATSLSHTYGSAGTDTVSLIVSGPVGVSTNTQANYIVVITPAQLGVNPGTLNYGSITVGLTNSLSFSVINSGQQTLTGAVATASPFLITSGSPYTVAGGQTQTVSVAFAPVAVGSFTNSAIFTSNGGVSTNAVNGTGLAAGNISVTPASYSFGALTTGTTAQTTLVVTNSGGTAVSNGTVNVTGPYSILSGATFSVAGFGTTNVVVQFAPVAVGGFTNNVIFTSANGGATTNAVNGTGLAAGNISVTPASYSFGALTTGTTAQTTLVVTNSGGTAVSNGTVSVTGPYSILSGATFSVAGFGTTNVVVQFAPVAVGGFTNNVIFTSANGGATTNSVNGTGAIVPVALFTGSPTNGVAPLAVTFTDSSTGTITNRLWNLGDGTTTNTMATSLSHTYGSAGTDTVSLIVSGPVGVSTNTQANYIVVITPAQLGVNPGSLNYGSVTVGLTNSLSFSVINSGQQTLTGTVATASPFLIASGSPYTVAGGQTATVSVAFAPVAVGSFTNSAIFTSNGGVSTNTVTGTGLAIGNISVSPASYSFGALTTGTTAQTTLVVTNSGGTAVSNGTVSVTGPYSILSGATFSVPGFGTTNVVVQFAPVAVGSFTNNVIFTSTNGGATTNSVNGTGAIVPVALFTGSPTNGAAPLAVTFTDSSTGTITNRLWNLGDGTTTNTMATSLSHTYGSTGTDTVILTVYGPLGTNSQARTNYVVVVNAPHLVVNPGSLTYGSVTVGQSNSLNFAVINTGDLSLTGTVATASPFLIASGNPYAVAGGQTATVSVAFAPTASGTFTGSVAFTANGGASTNTVSGTGLTAGNISVSPTSYSFGALTTGTTAQTTLVVTNSGGTAVSNGTASVTGPFSILSGATFSVPGFGTTNVVVQFAPVAVGSFTNNVIFTSANGGTPSNTVNGTGAIVPVALFTGSPTNGTAPLVVTFADTSTGTISNRFWSFGDSTTTNTMATSLSHTYSSAGTNPVSLTVFGPLGSSMTNRIGYIVVATPDTTPPQLTVSSPTNYQTFTNAATTVSGTASDASGIQSVTVNGAVASVVGTNWSTQFTLDYGTNTITVIATDASANMNTATQVVHAVLNPGTSTNRPPQITAGLSVTNALLQAGNTAVVLLDETNTFSVTATDADSDTLEYQWAFGDGDGSNTTIGTVEHVYTNQCGPYSASVTVSDGQASTNSDLIVAVACQMQVRKLQVKLDFAKTNSDSCMVQGTVDLPADYSFAGKLATLDVGGAEVSFTLPNKRGSAHNGYSTFGKPTYNKKTGLWTVRASFRHGFWQTEWADYGMISSNLPNPGVLVTNFPLIFVVDTEAFMGTTNLHYTAKQNKSGAAK
jgi:T5SS/PEP-CTERM-associated repeat protein